VRRLVSARVPVACVSVVLVVIAFGVVSVAGAGTASETYDQEIAYTQTRPAFVVKRTVAVAGAAALRSAIANLQPGDLVKATGSFTVASSTRAALTISKRLSAPAEIDLTGVKIVYTGTQQFDGVWVNNASNLYIFGGDLSTSDRGGVCLRVYGSQHVLWWGFTAHDCGGTGFQAQAIGGPVDHNDFQGTITKVGQNLAWDPHDVKGTGLHAANLWDAPYTGNFTNNRFAFYAHDIPVGACVQFGNTQPSSQATGNTLYLKCVNETEQAPKGVAGNALQLWGDTNTVGLDAKYIECDNCQGRPFEAASMFPGQNLHNVTVEYGRGTNINLNPRFHGRAVWDTTGGAVFDNVAPTP